MSSWIDPRIVPSTARERVILQKIGRLGLTAHLLHADGRAVRVTGPGVFVTVASLGGISSADLRPVELMQRPT